MTFNLSLAMARDWMRNLFVWDVAEKQRILRAATAKGYGLSPDEYARPFPWGAAALVLREQEKLVRTRDWAGKAALAFALLLAAATGATGLYALTRPPIRTPPAAPQEFQVDWSIDPATGEMRLTPPRRVD